MASLEARVVKLEQGGVGVCQCKPRRVIVLWPDGTHTGPDVCPSCGRPVLVIRVQYENPEQGAGNGAEPTS